MGSVKLSFHWKREKVIFFLFLFFYFVFQPSQEIERISSVENPDIVGTKFNHGGTTSISSRKQVNTVKSDYHMVFFFFFLWVTGNKPCSGGGWLFVGYYLCGLIGWRLEGYIGLSCVGFIGSLIHWLARWCE